MPTIFDRLAEAIRSAAVYNPDVQAAPVCILWPDRDRQWEAVVPRLQAELPELFVLGDYRPEARTGPAIWLRCVLAGKAGAEKDPSLPDEVREAKASYARAENLPVFYLPGFGRQDLRAVETCPRALMPLAELQYRGVIWSQVNAKDWTILAFLKSDQGGLGLDVAQDNDAKHAMQLALPRLLGEDVALLQGKRLDRDYFNTLLAGGDPVRDLLRWLDRGEAFASGCAAGEWSAFVEVCKSQFAFDPANDGLLAGAGRLALRKGPWQAIWERFCEAPTRYPEIPARIRTCSMPLDLFANAQTHAGWPQWNEGQEKDLRAALAALGSLAAHDARKRLAELDRRHRERRKLVWVELEESPLALALKHLATLSEVTASGLAAGAIADLEAGYAASGWKADAAVLAALACVEEMEDLQAVTAAIRAVYLPWAEDAARHLQQEAERKGYPGGPGSAGAAPETMGECLLFVDGLRYDVALRLEEMLARHGCRVSRKPCWCALPSVTATGKPAVSPVRAWIRGELAGADFEPVVAASGQPLKGGNPLKKLLADNGWTVLDKTDCGKGSGKAWCEFGNLDHEGHLRGWKLARHLPGLLAEVCDRTRQLLGAGWKAVRIVTDHGWLLLPGGLPKSELPAALVENKWGRCAVVKPGAVTPERSFPWFWNPEQGVVLADGISCFKKGEEYAHGGLSLQECRVQELRVTSEAQAAGAKTAAITDVLWKGLRCKIAVDGGFAGLSVDIRARAGNPESSLVMTVKPIDEKGMGSVVIENEDQEGSQAVIVLLDPRGEPVAQTATVIGGGTN